MTDIVERLRSRAWEDRQHRQLREQAAAEITALRAKLAGAYEEAAKVCEERVLETPSDDDVRCGIRRPYMRDRTARDCAAAIRALAHRAQE